MQHLEFGQQMQRRILVKCLTLSVLDSQNLNDFNF